MLLYRLWKVSREDLLLFAADKNKVVYDVLGSSPCRTCQADGTSGQK